MKGLVLLLCICVALVYCQDDLPPCTDSDLVGYYSACTSLLSTRQLYFYYPATCDSSSLSIPPPQMGLPCNITCDPGSYLPLNSTTCSACPAGSFSLGGGVRFHVWNQTFPKHDALSFHSYCSEPGSFDDPHTFDSDCRWALGGYELNSGNMTGKSSLNSVLSMDFTLLVDGFVEFAYMTTSDQVGDLFMYILDNNYPVRLIETSQYATASVDVGVGQHNFKWVFYKNPEEGTGAEIARIGYIEVVGTAAADDVSCTKCGQGTYQADEGAEYCHLCKVNTYADTEGATECISCSSGQYAAQGSSMCLDYERPCTENDMVALYTECAFEMNTWTRTMYYNWSSPLLCDRYYVDLPPSVTGLACSPCPPGSISVGESSNGQCTQCPPGFYSNKETDTCESCKAGTAAIPEMNFSEWDFMDTDYFQTYCYGPCVADGWQLYSDFIRASLPQDISVDLLLNMHVNIDSYDGYVEFDWILRSDAVFNSYFEVTVNGVAVFINDPSDINRPQTDRIHLMYGYHTIGFWAHGDGSSTCYVDISTIRVLGVYDGAASECSPCTPGFYQPNKQQQECLYCPVGTFSNTTNASKCEKCPANTFSGRLGSSGCTPCPEGATSLPGSTYCQNPNCTFIVPTNHSSIVYNLSPYLGVAQMVDNGEQFKGYYLLSFCGALAAEDSPCVDSHLCEIYNNFNPYNPADLNINWGTSVEFEAFEDPATGFALHYYGGQTEGCISSNRSASVYLYCNSGVNSYPQVALTNNSTSCYKEFSQTTIYGCPVCHMSDFKRVEGDCIDGKMTVSYQKKKNSHCNGILRDITEECGQYQSDLAVVIILSVFFIMVVLALIVAVILLYLKLRNNEVKYKKLKETVGSTVELDELESGDAEDIVDE